MRSFLIAAFLGAATAIPCYELTAGDVPDGRQAALGGRDPFDPRGDWDVVEANDAWVRFQAIWPGQLPRDARVTKTVFHASPSQVRDTINNYFGGPENIQLWLPLRTKSLQYAHMLPGNMGRDHEVVDPQSSISNFQRVIVSIILPSAKGKLEEVSAEPPAQDESKENIKIADAVGITGLKGEIASSDWAYTTGLEFRMAMYNIRNEQQKAYKAGRPWKKEGYAWMLAEKANGDCVVIDFRNFEEFVIRMRPGARR
ncbi:uncharacterized protein B0J16DRAFT_186509 [Fusarium flagelliforme]|uniref:uncharacterized protein n=1 Tax=Fusarium flagelliforme TaxID=2675880 RepID=UPI001E8E96D5|nr:uncharacterized protein B0J16DRAFT_186509 [Fusarium flagelliforme]KAH7175012.1 hypothetical protein B0J16DRAFT_186509 [Fusarium flagelliforme]